MEKDNEISKKKPRNPQLYRQMKDAIRDSLNFLKEKFKSKIIPYNYDYNYDLVPQKNDKKLWCLEKISISSVLYVETYANEIFKLSKVISCVEFMLKKDFLKKLEIASRDEIGRREMSRQLIIEFLRKYVHYNSNFDFNDNLFEIIYFKLEKYVYTKGIEIITVTPLLDFEIKDCEKIKVAEFIIRKLNKDEIKKFIKRGDFAKINLRCYYIETDWCIEFGKKFKSKTLYDYFEYRDLNDNIQRIISALRLFKPGTLNYSTTLRYSKIWRCFWLVPLRLPPGQRKIGYESRYELSDKDIKDFKKFWHKFKKINLREYLFLDIAIRRFNFSYNRTSLEDKLIDLIIALEALFRPKAQTEIGEQLALGCAYFLGKNKKEREKISDNIKKAYKIRNKIIHGEASEEITTELLIVTPIIEDYVRRSIKEFISSEVSYILKQTKQKIEDLIEK
jgi:hypothetical protein